MQTGIESLRHKTITSLGWTLFERGGRAGIELLVQIILARLLEPEMFGMLAIMLVFVNLGSALVQSGLNAALVQAKDLVYSDYSTVFWLRITLASFLWVVIFFAAPYIAGFYGMREIVWPMRALATIFVIYSWNGIQIAIVNRSLEYRKIFIATIVSVIASGIAGIMMALSGFGLWALVVHLLTYRIVNCITLAVQVKWHPIFVFRIDRARTLTGFGWKILVSGLLDTGYASLIDLIIGKQFSSIDLGYISQGQKYPRALGNTITEAISPVALASVSRIQEQPDDVRRVARRALRTASFVVFPMMATFALTAKSLVVLLIGPKWIPAVLFMQMYCVVFALRPVLIVNQQVMSGMGWSGLILKLNIVRKAIGLILLFVAAFLIHSTIAVVAGFIIESVIGALLYAIPNQSLMGYSLRLQVRDILPSLALTIIALLIAFPFALVLESGLLLLLLQSCIMVIVYVGLAWILRLEPMIYSVRLITNYLYKKRER